MKRIFLAAIIVFFVVTLAIPWSPMWRTEYDLNLVSGRSRKIFRVCLLPVSSKITETPVSLLVGGPDDDRSWVPERYFSPGYRHSPHFRHHSAHYNMGILDMAWSEGDWDAGAKRLAATHYLRLLRDTGGDHEAGRFADAVWRAVSEAGRLRRVNETLIRKIIAEGDATVRP